MKKPTAKARPGTYLSWSECSDYIEYKYKKKLRNYAGRKFTGFPSDKPYQDFWHWIISKNEISNGCEFSMVISEYDTEEPWVMEILGMIKTEFGNEPNFWVEW